MSTHELKLAPVMTLIFVEPLLKAQFDALVDVMFNDEPPFSLWGHPMRMGPMKVHCCGADRTTWKPISLEVLQDKIVAFATGSPELTPELSRLKANVAALHPLRAAYLGDKKMEQA